MKRKEKNLNHLGSEGQAIIEFTLSLMMVISFFFFYVRLAAIFAVGNYLHYATFMSARAYFSSAASTADQQANAEAVLQKMVAGKWKKLIIPKGGSAAVKGATVGPGPYFIDNPKENNWNQGVMFSYESNVGLYPWDKVAPPITLKLTSESWMGKEEATDECLGKKKKLRDTLNGTVGASDVIWENGNDGC